MSVMVKMNQACEAVKALLGRDDSPVIGVGREAAEALIAGIVEFSTDSVIGRDCEECGAVVGGDQIAIVKFAEGKPARAWHFWCYDGSESS